jgi:FkbM family methyltransferase
VGKSSKIIQMSGNAPIVLFAYNRPHHILNTLEALAKNELAEKSCLFIYCDGPKANATHDDLIQISRVRDIVRSKKWCGEVHVICQAENQGLAKSIISGVAEIVDKFEKVIVLEDDLITSPGFLTYMNDALNFYETDTRVMHIAGYFPKTTINLPETFFYNVSSCWGWGTWKRAWHKFDSNANRLLKNLQNKGYNEFLYNGGQKDLLYQQLIENCSGERNTWAVKWHTSIFLEDGFCLHPKASLTQNIGHDFSGENSGTDNPYQHVDLQEKVSVKKIPVEINQDAYIAIGNLYKQKLLTRLIPSSVKNRIKTLIDSQKRKAYLEKRRLYKFPRFQKGSAQLLSHDFFFVDAATFLHGFEEIFESEIYKFNSTTECPYIIDCGSNIGLSVVYFKTLFSKAKLIAFEPDKEIAATLQKNVDSFQLDKVTIHQKAIWKDNNGIEFQVEGGFSGRIPKPGDKDNIVSVPTQRLKDLLVEKIDFLKMDIEGAEHAVLMDCGDSLQLIENLFIEYHSHSKEDQNLHEILSLLHKNNFRYHIHEAYVRKSPFVSKELMTGMDLQLNIYAINQNK